MPPSVTFETKCWENDWEFLLKTGRIQRMVENSPFDFMKRSLIINNVSNTSKVSSYAEKLVNAGVLTEFYLVRDHEHETLEFFGLTKQSLGAGYVYSVAELVGIYLCQTDFLLHFSGDVVPSPAAGWIEAALKRFQADSRVKVANLTWNRNYAEAAKESFAEDDQFYAGYGFSDQMYLVRASDFRSSAVYHERNEASERYPRYGGELFEKRVDSWMRNHAFHRLTYKHGSYEHRNFPRNGFRRSLQLLLERARRKPAST
jgi:hypothetical protein